MKRLAMFVLLLVASACERGPEEVPAEVLEERRAARRLACVSAELARAAEEDVQTLGESFGAVEGPAATLTRQAARAALEYAEAYRQHALLRQAAAASIDSAFNYSAASADSLRHARQAQRFVISAPEPGTVEANVVADYERKLAALLADEDHPCNWDLEE